jgi:hypothetical protein
MPRAGEVHHALRYDLRHFVIAFERGSPAMLRAVGAKPICGTLRFFAQSEAIFSAPFGDWP